MKYVPWPEAFSPALYAFRPNNYFKMFIIFLSVWNGRHWWRTQIWNRSKFVWGGGCTLVLYDFYQEVVNECVVGCHVGQEKQEETKTRGEGNSRCFLLWRQGTRWRFETHLVDKFEKQLQHQTYKHLRARHSRCNMECKVWISVLHTHLKKQIYIILILYTLFWFFMCRLLIFKYKTCCWRENSNNTVRGRLKVLCFLSMTVFSRCLGDESQQSRETSAAQEGEGSWRQLRQPWEQRSCQLEGGAASACADNSHQEEQRYSSAFPFFVLL